MASIDHPLAKTGASRLFDAAVIGVGAVAAAGALFAVAMFTMFAMVVLSH